MKMVESKSLKMIIGIIKSVLTNRFRRSAILLTRLRGSRKMKCMMYLLLFIAANLLCVVLIARSNDLNAEDQAPRRRGIIVRTFPNFRRSRHRESMEELKIPFIHVVDNFLDEEASGWHSDMGDIIPTARNATPPKTRLLIYNRVPKCGSTSTYKIINRMRLINDYNHRSSNVYLRPWLNSSERQHILHHLFRKTKKRPRAFDRHMFFFNATALGYPQTAWMNMVREPVDRFISLFYFSRLKAAWNSVNLPQGYRKPPSSWFKMQLDECYAEGYPECRPAVGDQMILQLSFFCGHHPSCLTVGSWEGLQRAKYNAEKHYSVIGVIEQLPLSLTVLKHYLPRFFSKLNVSIATRREMKNRNPERLKLKVSFTTVSKIRDRLQEDVEFYYFLCQRLHLQGKALQHEIT